MNRKIKSFGLTAIISLILVMGYMIAPPMLQPDNYVQTNSDSIEQNSDMKLVEQPDDSYMLGLSYVPYDSTPAQAEALVPAVIGAGVIAGTAGVGYGFYKGVEVGQYFRESNINESEANDVIRTDVHDASISADGGYDSWADGIDNDLNTIEGSALQVVNNELINEADNLTSESETVVTAENAVSDYLWGTNTNIVKKHNYHTYDLAKNQIRKLDSANYSDYYVARGISAGSSSELNTVFDTSGYPAVKIPTRYNLTSDISINKISFDEDTVIDGNGYNFNVTGGASDSFSVDNSTLILKDVDVNIDNGISTRDSEASINLIDNTSVDVAGTYSQSGNPVGRYADSTTSYSGWSLTPSLDNLQEFDGYLDVTLDPADVSNPEANIEFTHNNSTVNMTGINVSVASSYSNATEAPLQVAVPYVPDGSGGYQPMDYANGSKLYVDTPTSGIYDKVEPVQFSRTIDIIQTRDSRSDAVYNTVSTHASNTWNDTIKTVANDDNLSATDFENVTEDLSIFNVDTVDANDTDAILSQYAGVYDSVAQPSDTRINLTNGDGTQYKEVVLFSTDMKTLMNQTSNSSVLAVNDTFNASDVSRTFVVDPDTAEVSELSGDVTIDGIVEDGQSVDDVDIQAFDLLSTDLSKQANAIQESVDVTIETVDDAQSGGDFTIPPILSGGNGAGTLVVLGVIVAIILRRRQN